MIVGSEIFIPVFATVKVANFLGEVLPQSFDEISKVVIIERVVIGHVVPFIELVLGAFVF